MTLQLFSEGPLYVNGNSINQHLKINLKEPLVLKSFNMGTYNLEFRLMGLIPVKNEGSSLPETRLVPGGHSLGVKLRPRVLLLLDLHQ